MARPGGCVLRAGSGAVLSGAPTRVQVTHHGPRDGGDGLTGGGRQQRLSVPAVFEANAAAATASSLRELTLPTLKRHPLS